MPQPVSYTHLDVYKRQYMDNTKKSPFTRYTRNYTNDRKKYNDYSKIHYEETSV